MNKYNLTAIAATALALGVGGAAYAKDPNSNKPPKPVFEDFGPVENVMCEYEGGRYFEGSAEWDDGIGTGEGEVDASKYGGDMEVEIMYVADCEGGNSTGEQFLSVEFDLDHYTCEEGICEADIEVDLKPFVAEDAQAVCQSMWSEDLDEIDFAEIGYVDFSVKYLDPGWGKGRQNHTVVTVECEGVSD